MYVVRGRGPTKHLVVVADNSLVLEAITIGLRKSGVFKLLGYVHGGTGSVHAIVKAGPDVVLVEDMDGSEHVVELVEQIKAEQRDAAVIVLTTLMEPAWVNAIFDAGAAGAISMATYPAALATLVQETIDGHVVHVYKSCEASRAACPTTVAAEQSRLTSRELEVLQLVAAGSTNGESAQKPCVEMTACYRSLHPSEHTQLRPAARDHGAAGSSLKSFPQRVD